MAPSASGQDSTPPVACPTNLVTDSPSDTDAFGAHGRIAQAIAQLVMSSPGGKSIGLLGTWGCRQVDGGRDHAAAARTRSPLGAIAPLLVLPIAAAFSDRQAQTPGASEAKRKLGDALFTAGIVRAVDPSDVAPA